MNRDVIDLHTHTLASGHAYNTIYEMVSAAAQKGIEILGITEHAPKMPGTCHVFYFENLHVVERQRLGVKLLLGSEVNILDAEGTLDLEDRILAKMDVNIASLHPPCIPSGTVKENTDAAVNAMKNPYISVLGHPDDGRYPIDYEVLVKAAKETGTILEINNASLSPNSFRPNTAENDLKMLSYCKQYEVPILMGSDAHTAKDVGNHENCMRILAECDFPKHLILNGQTEKLLAMIKEKRAKALTNE